METKRQSILARAAMTLLFTVLTTVTTWAAEWPKYITDVILVGGTSSEVTTAKNSHSGYEWCTMDLNDEAGGDYIYLGYKKGNTANTNGGYITDFIIIDAEGTNPPSTVTYSGRTYRLCDYDGGSHFESVKGNLNSNCSGWNLYLYYTRVNIGIQAVSSITINSTQSGAVSCYYTNGSLHAANVDLNKGAGSSSTDVYMHFGTANKVNRPYPEPSMASNLVYTGSPLKLISSTYTNNNTGTLYYRVGTSGSYTSDVNNVTATNAGTYTVYYYSGSNSYGNSSESYAHSKTVTIGKAQNSGATVVCADALESDGPSPSVTGNLSGGAITYTYAPSQNGSYSDSAPSTEGTYWVKATIAGDNNCNEYTTAAVSFKLKHDWGVHNTGNTANDAYVISTTEDLNLLSSRVNAGNTYQNKFFKLGGNITYDGTENNFTPIGINGAPFAGTFDGNRKTISGLNINQPSTNNIGLFGMAGSAVIKNLTLANSTICGNNGVGAILGDGSYTGTDCATVENCVVASTVTVTGSNDVGGIAGEYATVRGCVCAATVSATSTGNPIIAGGIIGNGSKSTVSHCLYTGTSVTAHSHKGAIVGSDTNTTLTANYYTANLTCGGTNEGDRNGARKAIAINAADGVTVTPTGTSTAYNVSGITAYDGNNGMSYGGHLYAGATETVSLDITYNSPYEGFSLEGYHDGVGDTSTALTHVSDNTYTLQMPTTAPTVTPVGSDLWGEKSGRDGSTAEKAYLITTTAGLDLLAKKVNGTDGYTANSYENTFFELGNDIAYDKTKENNYTPIGDSHWFSGTFDGKGHTISGIRISDTNGRDKAIFGIVLGTVKNLVVSDCSFEGNLFIGGIVAILYGTIENCHVLSDVTLTGNSYVGGIASVIHGGTIKGCTSAATIIGTEAGGMNAEKLGGIVGTASEYVDNSPKLTDNLFTGTISGDIYANIGAIVGKNFSNAATLTNNYYTVYGLGGVGSEGSATGSDEAGAQFARSSDTKPDDFDNATKIYGEDTYIGIKAYGNNGLEYGGKYYYPLWGGSGTETAPYIIYNIEGLDKLASEVNNGRNYEGKFFELGDNIIYDGSENNYTPIGDHHWFSGTFDGKGHTISGIRISDTEGQYKAIFGYVDGTVKNLVVSDCSFEGNLFIGGIVAILYGTIENCHVLSDVTLSSHAYIGGITAEIERGTIKGCTCAATITGTMVNDSKASYLGGITGYAEEADDKSTLTDNLFTGTISGELDEYIGAIFGKNDSNVATLTNNYYTTYGLGGVGNPYVATGGDEDGAKFAVSSTTKPDDFGNATKIYGEGDDTGITAYEHGLYYNGKYYYFSLWGGSGTASDPYVIYNTEGLDKLATNVNGGNYYDGSYFVLGNDIAYVADALILDLDNDGENDSNYMPVGNGSSFMGNFDGQGHTISGIRVNANGMYRIGVFGINDGTVKNLTVSDCLFAGDGSVGVIAGLTRGTVENCHVAADVSVTGNNGVGGIVGNNEGSVLGCTSAATLSAKESAGYFGGIAGRNTGTLTDNLFTGTIDKMPVGSWRIGAIIGYHDTDYGGMLTNNFHTCSGMGGVGNLNDATNTDQDGAQFAVSRSTRPDASIIGEEKKTYGSTDYTGITAYENGLYYNGKYYYFSLWGGSGTASDPYVIYNTEGLDKLATNVNGGNDYDGSYFVLGNDIVYAPDVLTLDLDNDGENDSNYMPVGNSAYPFCGNFDGQGHTISGIRVNANEMDYIGVFGINDGTVKNLTVSDCLFAGSYTVGAIAGLTRGTVENCHVAAGVSVIGVNGVGGIVADNEGSVLGCTSAATLSAKEYAGYFGGIAGRNTGTLTDNLFTGTIDEMPVGSWYIGAITGYHYTDYGGTLTNNFHICSGVGGVGNENDATNTDQAGAQFAISSTTPPASIDPNVSEPTAVYSYTIGSTQYIGITAYEHALYYNGKYYYWSEDIVVPGDANGDGMVTISDAVAIVNYILGKEVPAGFSEAAADVNGDGKVTISDAVAVVNMLQHP